MGTSYYILKKKGPGKTNIELFDLDKGNWICLQDELLSKGHHEFSLYCALLEHVAYHWEESTTLGYFKELAKRIIEWIDEDEVFLVPDYELMEMLDWSTHDEIKHLITGER